MGDSVRAVAGGRLVRLSLLVLAGLLVAASGCQRHSPPPAVESGTPVKLSPGQILRLTDCFRGSAAPAGLPRRLDGQAQILLGSALQPVLYARAPHLFRQPLVLPSGAKLRIAFGLSPGGLERGEGVRFTITTRQDGRNVRLLSEESARWAGGRTSNWAPVDLDLPAGDVELELTTEVIGKAESAREPDAAAACALWVNPMVLVPGPASRPNLVLVLIDALRADHLGCYGYPRDTSPYLDRLAARGVLFEDANAMATWTYPSVQGLLTSSYQDLSFGREVSQDFSAQTQVGPVLTPAIAGPSLQGELRDAGYETLACVGGAYLDPRFGFDVGFDWYWSANYPMLPDQLVAMKGRLPRTSGQPFFLFLHTYEVHHYRKGFGHGLSYYDRGYTGKLTKKDLIEEAVSGRLPNLTPADRQYLKDLYDGEVRHADEILGAFLDWLFAQPWGRNTVVAVIADHGEAFGEHGEMGHGGAPYREEVRVPLILYRSRDEWRGLRVKQPVSLIDLAPTLLELAAASRPAEMYGRSLAPQIMGQPLTTRPLLAGDPEALLARDGPWSYLRWRNGRPEELYHSLRDPAQRHNLAATAVGDLGRMRGVLAQLAAQSRRGYHLAVALPSGRGLTVAVESTTELEYYDLPTLATGDTVTVHRVGEAGQRLEVHLGASRTPHLLLFDSAQGGTVSVSARVGNAPVEAARFHLGKTGAFPRAVPVIIKSVTQPSLVSGRSPLPVDPKEWGLWLWQPSGASGTALLPTPGSGRMPEDLRRQLKALGYLK